MFNTDKQVVIFDLDGTLANVETRRDMSMDNRTGKINWRIFLDPKNIELDTPNEAVLECFKLFKARPDTFIAIMSGRCESTKDATMAWLSKYGVEVDHIQMRPNGSYVRDDIMKQEWLSSLPEKVRNEILVAFDDRQGVVDMWRRNKITCFQVAGGDF
jgi:hypothetical protein